MATHAEALQRVTQRSLAAVGRPAEDDTIAEFMLVDPDEHIRKLYNGVLDGEDLDNLLHGLRAAAYNAVGIVVMSATREQIIRGLQVFLAQEVLLGMFMSDPAPTEA